jgi:hypothetical protein
MDQPYAQTYTDNNDLGGGTLLGGVFEEIGAGICIYTA